MLKKCMSWDKDRVQQDLEGEKINWSKFAREHQMKTVPIDVYIYVFSPFGVF